MSKNNANESAPEASASPGPAGDPAPQEKRRRPPDEPGSPAAAVAAGGEKLIAWATQEARPRRRQDREAGPSDKQVYVPPVTLPPNREHHAIDQQKIQVAPSLLKGIDERSRPTMRRIPVMDPTAGKSASEAEARALALGGRTARIVGVGQGVWPPPEDDAAAAARGGAQPRAQRVAAAGVAGAPAVVGAQAVRPPVPPTQPALAPLPQGAVPVWSPPRQSRVPLAPIVALVLLGGAAAVGVFFLRQPPSLSEEADVNAVRENRVAAEPTPTTTPAEPPTPTPTPAEPTPPTTALAEPAPQPPAAAEPTRPPVEAVAAPAATPVEVAAATPAPPRTKAPTARPARPAGQPHKPPKPAAGPEDVYDILPSKTPQPAPPVQSTAAPSTPPTTTAPPRPF